MTENAPRTSNTELSASLTVTLRSIERAHRDGAAPAGQVRLLAGLPRQAASLAQLAPTLRLKRALDLAVGCRGLGHAATWAVAGDVLVTFEQYEALVTRVKADRTLQTRLRLAERQGRPTLYRVLRRLIDTTPVPEALLLPLTLDDLRDWTPAEAA